MFDDELILEEFYKDNAIIEADRNEEIQLLKNLIFAESEVSTESRTELRVPELLVEAGY